MAPPTTSSPPLQSPLFEAAAPPAAGVEAAPQPPDLEVPGEPPARGTARLDVTRTDIRWRNLSPEVVRLEVTVHNRGQVGSRRTQMQVNAAPFGAFVDSQPMKRLPVPPIPPGRSAKVTTDFADPRVAPQPKTASLPRLPKSLPGWPAPSGPHWAGNFDVHIGDVAAERHWAGVVRLEAGRENFAQFFVGDPGRSDAYRYRLSGSGISWHPRLKVSRKKQPSKLLKWLLAAVPTAVEETVQLHEWTHGVGTQRTLLMVDVPPATRSGDLTVGVQRYSTGKEVLVEFGFGEEAVEPSCFRA